MNAIYALRTYTENKSMTRLLMLNLETYLSINCNSGNKSKGNLLQCHQLPNKKGSPLIPMLDMPYMPFYDQWLNAI